MAPALSALRGARALAIAGGIVYAIAVLAWAFATGIQFAADAPASVVIAVGYAAIGLFLVAAVPLYLLGRLSLVSPTLVTAWFLSNTTYQRWYVARPHDALASHLTVWPLFLGIVLVVALAEFGARVGLDRGIGRFGLRSLL